MENTIYKVIKKEESGYVIDIAGEPLKLSKEEFDKSYVLSSDGTTCTLTDEAFNRFKTADGLLNKGVTLMVLLNRLQSAKEKMLTGVALSGVVDKLHDILGIANDEIMSMITTRYQKIIESDTKHELDKFLDSKRKKTSESSPDNNEIQRIKELKRQFDN